MSQSHSEGDLLAILTGLGADHRCLVELVVVVVGIELTQF